jgi:hypothetical protein
MVSQPTGPTMTIIKNLRFMLMVLSIAIIPVAWQISKPSVACVSFGSIRYWSTIPTVTTLLQDSCGANTFGQAYSGASKFDSFHRDDGLCSPYDSGMMNASSMEPVPQFSSGLSLESRILLLFWSPAVARTCSQPSGDPAPRQGTTHDASLSHHSIIFALYFSDERCPPYNRVKLS